MPNSLNPTMLQAVIATPDRLELTPVPKPTLRTWRDPVLLTAVSGICSGDLMTWYLAKKVVRRPRP